ncbi:hypothetical protein Thethe_01188 [Thermoanaerobacterium thermosaccharolyticum M0795]|uniref:Uncharacterized protein n=1 Tax=Thermoanaerobacterium thermosaccharolyticum M0795 TaxID=698948 RepID=L0IKU9_THETR|nr:hypothetical protein Thethe_01188 [Thermoanaerobacterium thermosaccharolyticum M0795]
MILGEKQNPYRRFETMAKIILQKIIILLINIVL